MPITIPILKIQLFSLDLLFKIIAIRIRYLVPFLQFILGVVGASFIVWMLLNLFDSFRETGLLYWLKP
jgi:hypothetical protein